MHQKALDTLPLPLLGTSKPLQYMKDCMQFHIDNGNINEGFEVPKSVNHSDVLDRINPSCADEDLSLIAFQAHTVVGQ